MQKIVLLLALALPASAFAADVVINDCAVARDPARCEARQAALKTCAEVRGAAKHACLEQHMPPVDCTQASNPAKCEAAEKAKEVCRGKSGKALKQCLKGETPKKAVKKKAKKSSAPKPKAKQTR
jgi:hypothetical protein